MLINNLIKLKYENKSLEAEGESYYSFDTLRDKIEYKIKQKNNIYDFLASINFDKHFLNIKAIEYSKEKNKKSNLELKGSYSKNKVVFNKIIYNESKNFFEVRDLIFNNNFQVINVKELKVNYLNNNNKRNQLEIHNELDLYKLTSKSFDAYKIIGNIIFSDSDKNFLDNFSLSDRVSLDIYMNKVFLDEKSFSKNLSGKIKF